jgi:hypothetical protein
MADLTIAAADVAPVRVVQQFTGPAAEPIAAGQMVRLDTASGKFALANATSAAEGRIIGMAIQTASLAGETITVVSKGLVDVGDALTAQDYDEALELSNTDGTIDDGAGTPTAVYIVGRVFPAWGATTADKILLLDL